MILIDGKKEAATLRLKLKDEVIELKKKYNEIIEIQLNELEQLMRKNKVRLEIDKKAKEWLASEGFLPQYGARPLKRIIQKNIKNKVADIVLKSNSNDEINVKVTTNEDGLFFK